MADLKFPDIPIRYSEVRGRIPRRVFYLEFTKIIADIYLRNDLCQDQMQIVNALLKRYPDAILRGFAALFSRGFRLSHDNWSPLVALPTSLPRTRNASGLVIHSDIPGSLVAGNRLAVSAKQAVIDCLQMPKIWSSSTEGNKTEEHIALLDLIGRQDLDLLLELRKVPEIATIATYANPLAESRPESILRFRLHQAKLTDFRPQIAVRGQNGNYFIDIGDPYLQVGIDYQGAHHFNRGARARDAQRMNDLRWAKWTVLEATSVTLDNHQEWNKFLSAIRQECQEATARRLRRLR